MKRALLIPLSVIAVTLWYALTQQRTPAPHSLTGDRTLAEARRGFNTKLTRHDANHQAAEEPPEELFRVIRYRSPVGDLAAYISLDPGDGKKHTAIIWIFGGFSNGIGVTAWEPAPRENDQSARAFREAGIVIMYPSRRGGNDNPGFKEAFLGEVDDILAAADFLAKQDYVDPQRIYLGGHSTGGTLALLVAESSDRFRAVFSFGPMADPIDYGSEYMPFEVSDANERALRSPINWLAGIHTPTFVFDGVHRSNIDSLYAMSRASTNRMLHFYPIERGDHRNILAPLTPIIAAKILRDEGAATNITFDEREIADAMQQ